LRAPPDPLAAIGGRVPTSRGKGREGNGKREGRGWEGGREEGNGREGREREGGKGKDDLHPTLFLGPDYR